MLCYGPGTPAAATYYVVHSCKETVLIRSTTHYNETTAVCDSITMLSIPILGCADVGWGRESGYIMLCVIVMLC